jgi:hypothetical protein
MAEPPTGEGQMNDNVRDLGIPEGLDTIPTPTECWVETMVRLSDMAREVVVFVVVEGEVRSIALDPDRADQLATWLTESAAEARRL